MIKKFIIVLYSCFFIFTFNLKGSSDNPISDIDVVFPKDSGVIDSELICENFLGFLLYILGPGYSGSGIMIDDSLVLTIKHIAGVLPDAKLHTEAFCEGQTVSLQSLPVKEVLDLAPPSKQYLTSVLIYRTSSHRFVFRDLGSNRIAYYKIKREIPYLDSKKVKTKDHIVILALKDEIDPSILQQEYFIGESIFDREKGFALSFEDLVQINFSSVDKRLLKDYRWDIANPILGKLTNKTPSGIFWNLQARGGQSGGGVFRRGQLMGFLSAQGNGP